MCLLMSSENEIIMISERYTMHMLKKKQSENKCSCTFYKTMTESDKLIETNRLISRVHISLDDVFKCIYNVFLFF